MVYLTGGADLVKGGIWGDMWPLHEIFHYKSARYVADDIWIWERSQRGQVQPRQPPPKVVWSFLPYINTDI